MVTRDRTQSMPVELCLLTSGVSYFVRLPDTVCEPRSRLTSMFASIHHHAMLPVTLKPIVWSLPSAIRLEKGVSGTPIGGMLRALTAGIVAHKFWLIPPV